MANQELFQLLSTLLNQVESLTNEEEPELRSKIEALGLEVSKVPSKSTKPMDELEIASELDKLSTKLADVDKMISAADPEVKTLLSGTADVWVPVITATADERRNFASTDDSLNVQGADSVIKMSSTLARFSLENDKLNGLNFLDWYRNLRIVLKQERKLYVLDEEPLVVPVDSAPKVDKDAYKKYLDDAVSVSGLILETMIPLLQKPYENMMVVDMIEHMRKLLRGLARQEHRLVFRALFHCRMSEGSAVGDHVRMMINLIESLSVLGYPLGQELATVFVLQSLPESYDQFMLNYIGETAKTLPELLCMLRTAESYIKNSRPEIVVTHDSKGKGKRKGKAQTRGKSTNGQKLTAKRLKPKVGVAKERKCFRCGQVGHWKRNCPLHLEEIKKK